MKKIFGSVASLALVSVMIALIFAAELPQPAAAETTLHAEIFSGVVLLPSASALMALEGIHVRQSGHLGPFDELVVYQYVLPFNPSDPSTIRFDGFCPVSIMVYDQSQAQLAVPVLSMAFPGIVSVAPGSIDVSKTGLTVTITTTGFSLPGLGVNALSVEGFNPPPPTNLDLSFPGLCPTSGAPATANIHVQAIQFHGNVMGQPIGFVNANGVLSITTQANL